MDRRAIPPRATYRLQLRREFGFRDAAAITEYLERLGISHLYLSPILESTPGSNHGYDGVDPGRVSDERGGEASFARLMRTIEKRAGLVGAILDIVPNHLAATLANPAWRDLLKQGPSSEFSHVFDVGRIGTPGWRLVLPVLGKSRAAAIAGRELRLGFKDGELGFWYFDRHFPARTETLHRFADQLAGLRGKERDRHLAEVPLRTLESALNEQFYVLEEWRAGSRRLNYRRFFDINDLVGVRVEDPRVFDWSHRKILELWRQFPELTGLRVDHIDGLTDPESYLRRLGQECPNVWVEKILAVGEKLPATWPCRGTTGYEFSNACSRVFVDLAGLNHLHAHYLRRVDSRWESFRDCVFDGKREILESHFVAELDALAAGLAPTLTRRAQEAIDVADVRSALIDVTSALGVYRTYARRGEPLKSRELTEALLFTEGRGGHRPVVIRALRLFFEAPGDWSDEEFYWLKRWEQLSGPAMAKGLEDTALYRYFPHLSLNGVGGEPDWQGPGVTELHAHNAEKLRDQPWGLNATSTHDTKRSEDVRGRLHVISEIAERWTKAFESWRKIGADAGDEHAVTPATRYMIFETLVGAWPLNSRVTADFEKRMQEYFLKAAREAKLETSWNEPDTAYEATLRRFVHEILRPRRPDGRRRLREMKELAEFCAYYGAINSLALVTLKLMSPGVPDIYQGCEMWDLSLVDPDNRRPVDYGLRSRRLASFAKTRTPGGGRLLKTWRNGDIKLWLTAKLLALRTQEPDLFAEGEYLPVETTGEGARHVLAFLRRHGNRWLFVAVPRLPVIAARGHRPAPGEALALSEKTLSKVYFKFPTDVPEHWESWLDEGAPVKVTELSAARVFAGLTCAVWTSGRAPRS